MKNIRKYYINKKEIINLSKAMRDFYDKNYKT